MGEHIRYTVRMLTPQSYLKFRSYPLRKCQSVHCCCLCLQDITLGQEYYDGGYSRRAHKECVTRFIGCPACDGSGVMEGDNEAKAASILRVAVPCPECHGSGEAKGEGLLKQLEKENHAS